MRRELNSRIKTNRVENHFHLQALKVLRNYGRTELEFRETVGCGQVFEVQPKPLNMLENTGFLTTDYTDSH